MHVRLSTRHRPPALSIELLLLLLSHIDVIRPALRANPAQTTHSAQSIDIDIDMLLIPSKHIKTGPRSYARTVASAAVVNVAGGRHVQISVQIARIRANAQHRHTTVSMPLVRSRHIALTRPAFLCRLEMLLQVLEVRL